MTSGVAVKELLGVLCLREIRLKKDTSALQSQTLYRGCSITDDVIKTNFIVPLYRKDRRSTIRRH